MKVMTKLSLATVLLAVGGLVIVDWADTGSGGGFEFNRPQQEEQKADEPDEREVVFTAKWTPGKAHSQFTMNVLVNGESVGRRDQRARQSPMKRERVVKAGNTVGMVVYAPAAEKNSPEYDITCKIKNKITGTLYDSRTSFVGGSVQCFGVVH